MPQSAFMALVLNKPFNFLELVFYHSKEQCQQTAQKKKKFLMYPRFLQLIIHDLIPNLVIDQTLVDDVLSLEHMKADTVRRMPIYRKERPHDKRMIGHIINPDYVCPLEDCWIHDDSDSEREGEEGGNDGGDDGNDSDDGGNGGDGNAAFREQEAVVEAALAATIATQQERKRKGKELATAGSSKRRVSAGAGISFGVQPSRPITPQRLAVPLTTSTPMFTLTTTMVPHNRLRMIPQMALADIPSPSVTSSTITRTPTMMPPPPSDVSFMRITRHQGPIQLVHPYLYNMPTNRQTDMLLNLLHLYENQMSVDRLNQERLMENQ
ncbi:uncharacterized protein LOC143598463 [Bidens hawaiensis]|uniref:uncharacterized protein LOC143598463 n=1 Tax=Bidens hawaiensis TaxID=980011 RepID=UPI004048F5A4